MIRACVIGLAMLAASPAHGACRDTPHNRAACGSDVYALCYWDAAGGGLPAAIACLQRHRASLSVPCGRALAACAPRRREIEAGRQ